MQNIESSVKTKFIDYATSAKLKALTRQKLERQRQASVPTVAVVNNFDPDQKGFITPGLAGYTPVQTEFSGTIVANGDYGISPRYQNPDTLVYKYPFAGGRQIRPQPGQPVMVYRASADSPNMNTSFLRGGKAEPYRDYPSYPIRRNFPSYGAGTAISPLLFYKDDVDFCLHFDTWDSNSPLPPGVRWAEMNDIRYWNTNGERLALGEIITEQELADLYYMPVEDINQLLPQDLEGRPKVNVRPLPGELWSIHPTIFNNGAYWTGQVRNPVDWNDAYWYGASKAVDKTLLEAYLNTHPGSRF